MADELAEAKRATVIAWLRDLADSIEVGKVEADAGAIVLSEGDIHRAFSIGYQGRSDEWIHARQSLLDSPHGPTPEERAERRAEQERRRQAEQDAYEREHPWKCACGGRFKTHGGWKTHRGAMKRQASRYRDTTTIVYGVGSPSPGHEAVTEVAVPEPPPPVQLFPDVS